MSPSTPSPDRRPIFLLFGFGLLWLLVGGALALLSSLQLDSPGLLACCPWFTFGRTQALQESAFVYGWIANAGLAAAIWVLGRLGGEPLRAGNWMVVGTLFWNLGLALGLCGISAGDGTSYALLQLPRYVQPVMLVSLGAVAVGGVLAWTGRRRPSMYAAQWYAVAPLFFLPWLFSVTQVLLVWSPVRGALQAEVQDWYAQGLWSLWAAPIALAGAYYLIPRIKGGVLPSYDLAPLGFWCLVFVGIWTGGRHLIGGPLPAWISTVAIVTAFVMLSHYFVVALNLRGGFSGGGPVMGFLRFGLIAYLLGGLVEAITSIRAVAAVTEFTYFDEALRQLSFYGAASMILYAVLYFALPQLSGRPWASSGLARVHLVLACLGVTLLVVSLGAAGLIQGGDLNDAKVSFAEISGHTQTLLLAAAAAQAALLLGNLILALNFARSICGCAAVPAEAVAS